MRTRMAALLVVLVGASRIAGAQEAVRECEGSPPILIIDPATGRIESLGRCGGASAERREAPAHRVPQVWDPYLAQYRRERPGRVWDPYLARYRDESPNQVWDPYLARYRPRDARRDQPPAFDWQADGRHHHAGLQGWCPARH